MIAAAIPASVDRNLEEVKRELGRAMSKHAPYSSLHEAFAVLLEEVDEFWGEVKLQAHRRDNENIRKELIQVATVAIRAIHDLDL